MAYVPSFKPLRIIHSSTKTWVKYITNFPQRIYIFSSCLDSLSKTWPDLSSPSIVLGFYFFDFDLFNVIISKLSQYFQSLLVFLKYLHWTIEWSFIQRKLHCFQLFLFTSAKFLIYVNEPLWKSSLGSFLYYLLIKISQPYS